MYYLRKLSKLSTRDKLLTANKVEEIPADILKQEIPTTNNTLSVWGFETIDKKMDAVRAAILSSTGISKTDFIVFDDDLLKSSNILIDGTEMGQTGYLGFGNLHVNLCKLDYAAIGRVLEVMREVFTKEKYNEYYFQMSRAEVKTCIIDVYNEGLIDTQNINSQLLDDINKFIDKE